MVDFAALFQRSPNPYMVVDRDLRYLAVNEAYAAVVDTTADALIGRLLFDAFPGEVDEHGRPQADEVQQSILRVFRTGRSDLLALVPYAMTTDGPDGPVVETRFWSATHTPLFDAQGQVHAVLQHTTDVTDVQRTRAALEATRRARATPEQIEGGLLSRARAVQESNRELTAQSEHLKALFAQAPGFMAVLRGPDYVFEIANDAYDALVGGRRLIGRPLRDALPEVAEQGYVQLLDQVRLTARRFVGRGMSVDLSDAAGATQQRFVDFIYEPILDAQGRVEAIFVQGSDVTDRESAIAALRESEQKFRTISDMVPQIIWATTPDGRTDYYNQQWFRYSGQREEDSDDQRWREAVHPDDLPRTVARWQQSIATGQDFQIEHRLRDRNGEYRWFLGLAHPVRDADGAIVRWMGTGTEIHEQKLVRDMLEASQVELRATDRRKDRFLAILAHELRNPLAPIGTAAALLQMASHDAARVREASAIIERQVRHMTHLVNDLMDVSRVTRGLATLERAPMDLADAVRAGVEQVAPLMARKRHTLRVSLPGSEVTILGDAPRLVQVVANLLNNAAKYTPPGGEIDIDLFVDGEHACVEVRDNGIGIDAALLPHVFELFTQGDTTPERSEGGLGIGLSLVRSLVQLHGGTIHADSDGPGQGARFRVCVPCDVHAHAEPA